MQGFASRAASIGGVAALIASFFLIGKLSKLLLLRLAVATCAVFLALMKVSSTFAVFVAMWFGLGIGMGFLDMLVSSCMSDLYEGRAATPESSMLATTAMMFAVYLGQAVAPPERAAFAIIPIFPSKSEA